MTARPRPTSTPPRDPLLDRARRATVGQFEVIGTVRHESLAAAYSARDVHTGDRVTLRVFRPELFPNDVARDRFVRQTAGAVALRAPQIVSTRSVEVHDSLVMMVCEAIDGASLEQILTFEPALAAPVARAVLEQSAVALDEAHVAGVMHGSLRPSSVMITTGGAVLLADLGVVQALAASGADMSLLPSLSARYQSPDTIRTGFTSEAADQYSLGVIGYEMVMGKPPFDGPPVEVRSAHLNKRPPAMHLEESDIPEDLSSTILKMLGKSPVERFPSLTEVVAALAEGFSDFDDRSRGPLSWLAQRALADLGGDDGTSAPRRRSIVLTPLPFVETLPPIRADVRPSAPALVPSSPPLQPITDFAPAEAPAAAAAPIAVSAPTFAQRAAELPMPGPATFAERPLGGARARARSRRTAQMATAGVVVVLGGALAWRTFSSAPADDGASQTREQISFPDLDASKAAPAGTRAGVGARDSLSGASSSRPATRQNTPAVSRGELNAPRLNATDTKQAAPASRAGQQSGATASQNARQSKTAAKDAAGPALPVLGPPVDVTVNIPAPPVTRPSSPPVVQNPPSAAPQAAAPPPAAANTQSNAASETSRPATRVSEGDADRAARAVLERLRAADVDGLASGSAGTRADSDFLSWLRRKPVNLHVDLPRAGSVSALADGSARVMYSIPISWTHASGAKPVRTASIVVTVNESGKVASWSLASPFVP